VQEHNQASQLDSSSEEVERKEAVILAVKARPKMVGVSRGTMVKGAMAWFPSVSRERERGEHK
jgi:hypothetical protein